MRLAFITSTANHLHQRSKFQTPNLKSQTGWNSGYWNLRFAEAEHPLFNERISSLPRSTLRACREPLLPISRLRPTNTRTVKIGTCNLVLGTLWQRELCCLLNSQKRGENQEPPKSRSWRNASHYNQTRGYTRPTFERKWIHLLWIQGFKTLYPILPPFSRILKKYTVAPLKFRER